ncbi:MAG: hypothetical protein K1X79_02650 [Oligoflexia bacterium]|nr:hypothetical protein [Oligoflexia bacterium]
MDRGNWVPNTCGKARIEWVAFCCAFGLQTRRVELSRSSRDAIRILCGRHKSDPHEELLEQVELIEGFLNYMEAAEDVEVAPSSAAERMGFPELGEES